MRILFQRLSLSNKNGFVSKNRRNTDWQHNQLFWVKILKLLLKMAQGTNLRRHLRTEFNNVKQRKGKSKGVQISLIQMNFFFFFKILFIYSWETQTRERQRQAEGEEAPGREPDAGLDPGSPGSRPGLQAVLNRWATQGSLLILFHRSINIYCFLTFFSLHALVGIVSTAYLKIHCFVFPQCPIYS